MRSTTSLLLWVGCGLLSAVAPSAAGQDDACATCHFATADLRAFEHLLEWEESIHARQDVGCQSCHRGDPSSPDPIRAHAGVLSSSNPASPVHPAALPATCGACHAGPLTSFDQSRHQELLAAGDPRGPTCWTCHGTVAADLPTPVRLERGCDGCHGADGPMPRPGRAPQARAALERILDTRASLRAVDELVSRVSDPARRLALSRAVGDVEQVLDGAADRFHRFELDGVDAQLGETGERLDRLIDQILNPDD